MKYKPTDSFNANMKMIRDILSNTKKEIGGLEKKTSYILCVLVEGDNKEEDFMHLHGHGYLTKIVETMHDKIKRRIREAAQQKIYRASINLYDP